MTVTYKMFNIVCKETKDMPRTYHVAFEGRLDDEWESIESQLRERWEMDHRDYAYDGETNYTLESFDWKELKDTKNIGTVTFYAYTQTQCYGGPEEGGWWYWMPNSIRTFTVPAKNAKRHMDRVQRFLDARFGKDDKPVVTTFKPRTTRPYYC